MSLLNPKPEYRDGDNHYFCEGRCDDCGQRAYGIEYWATSAVGARSPVLHFCLDCAASDNSFTTPLLVAAARISKVIDEACARAHRELREAV